MSSKVLVETGRVLHHGAPAGKKLAIFIFQISRSFPPWTEGVCVPIQLFDLVPKAFMFGSCYLISANSFGLGVIAMWFWIFFCLSDVKLAVFLPGRGDRMPKCKLY